MSYAAVSGPPKRWLPNRRRPLGALKTAEVVGIAGLATFAVLSIVGLAIGLKDS